MKILSLLVTGDESCHCKGKGIVTSPLGPLGGEVRDLCSCVPDKGTVKTIQWNTTDPPVDKELLFQIVDRDGTATFIGWCNEDEDMCIGQGDTVGGDYDEEIVQWTLLSDVINAIEGGYKSDHSPFDPDCGPDEEDACEECLAYWGRMRDEGFWIDGEGWTDEARREWNK